MTDAAAVEAAVEEVDTTGCVVIMYSMNTERLGAAAAYRSKTAVVLRWLDWNDLMSWFAILSLSLG